MGYYLQEYLDRGLFNLGDKDERVGFLEDASIALVEKIKGDKSAIVRHTLLLLGPTVVSDNKLLDGIEKLIKENGWKTLRTIYPTRCLPMIRAVVLDALSKIIAADFSAANLVWLTASDYLRFIDDEKQKDLLESFFLKARANVEVLSAEEWAISSAFPKRYVAKPKSLKKIAIPAISIDLGALKHALTMASGPHRQGGNGRTVGWNTVFPNSGGAWSWQFAEIAGEQIGKVLNLASQKQSEEFSKAMKDFDSFLEEIVLENQEILDTAFAMQQEASKNGEQRSQLLWWKEALYSRTFQKGYREMSEFQACLALAKDFSDLVGNVTPLSMDYFLRESVGQVIPKERQSFSIQSFCENASSKENRSWLGKLFPSTALTPKRLLGSFANDITKDALKVSDCEEITGISPKTKASLADFAVWHFHYLQLHKNLHSK